MMEKLKKLYKALRMEQKEHKGSYRVYWILRFMVMAILITQIFMKNFESMFVCALTLILFIIPGFLQVTLKVELPVILESIVLIFIFAAEILGELSNFYIVFPFWDTLLHTLNGFLAAAVGFSLVDLLNKSDKLIFDLSPIFTAVVAFCFSMTIGVVWEFFEFAMDSIFLMDTQKDTVINTISSVMLDPTKQNIPIIISDINSVTVNGEEMALGGYLDIGLIDTMHDLIVNFIGAAVFSVIGYFYIKRRGRSVIVENFVPRQKKDEEDFLKKQEEKEE